MAEDWLANLKVGDEVAVYRSSFGSGYYEFRKIDKVHKAHFIINSTKYRRDSGRQAGEPWHPSYLKQATPELKEQVAIARRINILAQQFESTRWRSLPLETLETIYKLLAQEQTQ